MAAIGPDYTQVGATFDLNTLPVCFFLNGEKCTAGAASERLDQLPLLEWSTVFFNEGWLNGVEPFGNNYIDWFHKRAWAALDSAKLPEDTVHFCDFEDGKFYWIGPAQESHISTAIKLVRSAVEERGGESVVNYHTTSEHSIVPMGGGNNRMTPWVVPGLFKHTNLSTYDKPGHCTDAELADALAKCPRPFSIVLRLDDPQLVKRVRQANRAGCETVFVYGGMEWPSVPPGLARDIAIAAI
jgi:hypothetical protein